MISSKYSKVILITTIIAIIIFAIPNFLAIPTLITAGNIAAEGQSAATAEVVNSVVDLMVFIMVILLIVGIFAIISGFLLSLKEKWCMGCIVLSIILATYEVIAFFSSLKGGEPATLLLALANAADFIVMAVMAIKLRGFLCY